MTTIGAVAVVGSALLLAFGTIQRQQWKQRNGIALIPAPGGLTLHF